MGTPAENECSPVAQMGGAPEVWVYVLQYPSSGDTVGVILHGGAVHIVYTIHGCLTPQAVGRVGLGSMNGLFSLYYLYLYFDCVLSTMESARSMEPFCQVH